MKYCTRAEEKGEPGWGRGAGVQGTPSRSLRSLQNCQGQEEGPSRQQEGSWSERKGGREGRGVGYLPTPLVSQEFGLCL